MINVLLGIMIPFIGTTLGSALVFFMKNTLNYRLEKFFLGIAGGVMISASIWSLLLPAIDWSEGLGIPVWLPSTIGLVVGFLLLLIINAVTGKLQKNGENDLSKTKDKSIMIFAVTLHNIPEGLAVGVALAVAYFNASSFSAMSALMLSIGIAIQNFPEGAIVSMPLKSCGMSKGKSFMYGVLSGAVEPIAGIIAFFITGFVSSILPFVLSFAAGAMIFVVISELIPESQEGGQGNIASIGFAFGFILMMVLDIALG